MYVCADNLPASLLSIRPPPPLLLLDEIYLVVEDHNLILHLQVMQTGVHLLLGEGRVLLRQTLGERAQTGHLHHAIEYPTNHHSRVYVYVVVYVGDIRHSILYPYKARDTNSMSASFVLS